MKVILFYIQDITQKHSTKAEYFCAIAIFIPQLVAVLLQ